MHYSLSYVCVSMKILVNTSAIFSYSTATNPWDICPRYLQLRSSAVHHIYFNEVKDFILGDDIFHAYT